MVERVGFVYIGVVGVLDDVLWVMGDGVCVYMVQAGAGHKPLASWTCAALVGAFPINRFAE